MLGYNSGSCWGIMSSVELWPRVCMRECDWNCRFERIWLHTKKLPSGKITTTIQTIIPNILKGTFSSVLLTSIPAADSNRVVNQEYYVAVRHLRITRSFFELCSPLLRHQESVLTQFLANVQHFHMFWLKTQQSLLSFIY